MQKYYNRKYHQEYYLKNREKILERQKAYKEKKRAKKLKDCSISAELASYISRFNGALSTISNMYTNMVNISKKFYDENLNLRDTVMKQSAEIETLRKENQEHKELKSKFRKFFNL